MVAQSLSVVNWNPRGLNAPGRRSGVRDVVQSCGASIVCLQETKLAHISLSIVMRTLGNKFLDFCYLPAVSTRGGILMAWNPDVVTGVDHDIRRFSVTTRFIVGPNSWWLTTVYGPHSDEEQILFLDELRGIRATHQGGWIVTEDFNMIYQAADKNNPNVSRRAMGRFRRALDDMELRELPASDRSSLHLVK
jgi:exonuclease III